MQKHDENKRKARRRLLKMLGTGGGLASAGALVPQQWARPVVDAISLPVHARVSGQWYDVIFDPFMNTPPRRSLFERLAGKFLPLARAGVVLDFPIHVCLGPNGNNYLADVVLEDFGPGGGGVLYSAPVQSNSVFIEMDPVAYGTNCPPKVPAIDIRLDDVASNADGALRIFGDNVIEFSLPIQPCDLPGLGSCIQRGP